MTSRDGAARVHEPAREAFGDPEILVVNSPGAVPDPETGRWRGFERSSDEDFETIYRNFVMSVVYLSRLVLPVGRWGEPVEMGWLAAFLCSERAASLTGQTIRLDGSMARACSDANRAPLAVKSVVQIQLDK